MVKARSRIVKGAKDAKGNTRKYIQIPEVHYDDFEFGDIVEVIKVEKKEKVDRMPSPATNQKPTAQEMS